MANGAANSYTTYLRTELDPVTRQSYSQLRTIAEATYRDIGRLAQEASNTAAAGFGDRRSTSGLRSLETAATSTFGTIRREAATTAAAVSSMQQRLSSIRTTALSNTIAPSTAPVRSGTAAAAAANDNLAASNRRVAASSAVVSSAQARQFATTAAINAETGKLSRGLTVLGTTLSVVQGPLGPIAGRINAITSAVTTLGTGTLILAGAATALFAFAGVANVYAEVESRLKPLYSSQEQVNGALRETGRIALATRSALGPTADLYAKLTAAGREFNISQRQISRVTETAAKAATLSGGSAASREAGLYQFSQGLSSNKLGGDELKSILENIPELARAIAQGFKNADGSIGTTTGNLRKLGAEGALTAQVIADALTRSADTVDAKFSKLPKTIGSARTEFITAFTLLTGRVDQTVGVTSTLANVISIAAQNLQVLLALGGALAARFILPKLGGFISELTAASRLAKELQAQTAVAYGRIGPGATVTPLTPKGIATAKVSTATGRVAEEQAIVTAIEREIAATEAASAADKEKARSAQANARFEVISIEQKIAAIEAEIAARKAAQAAAATNVATFASAAPLVNRPLADGEQEATRAARIAAFTEQETAAKVELGQANLRVAITERQLAAAQAQSVVAAEALTAATVTQAAAANANASRGLAALSLQEQRIAANAALIVSEEALAVEEAALAAVTVELTLAQRAQAIASATAGAAASAAVKGFGALSAAVGGPLVLALTLAAGAMIYLAGQSEAALDSLHNFAGGQDELNKRLGITTDKLNEQSEAYKRLAIAAANTQVAEARQNRAAANRDLSGSLATVATRAGYANDLGPNDRKTIYDKLNKISADLANGRVISPQGAAFISELYNKKPKLFEDSGIQGGIDSFLGKGGGKAIDKVRGALAADISLADAMRSRNEISEAASKPSGPTIKPRTNEEILAEGSRVADSIKGKRDLAARRFEERKKDILADKNDTEQEKIDKIADATAAYKEQIKALDARDARAAKAIATKAEREHAKAVRAAEKATREAAAATEKLADLRSKYDDQPKLVDQIRNDQRTFDSLIGQKINVTGPDGQVQLNKDGSQKRRTYTATDAMIDSQKAETALNKPFADMTKEMDRQLQIQALTLQGREAEADALQRSFQLIDRTGSLTIDQYNTLVSLSETQNTINAALEERGRIVSTLRGTVDTLRDSVLSFLDDLPNKAGQVGKTITGKNGDKQTYGTLDFAKDALGGLGGGLLKGFTSSQNKLGVDGLFSGLQKKVDDLISGRTGLVNATTFTATQTQRTGTAVQRFGNVIDEVSEKVQATLAGIQGAGPGPIGASGVTSPFSRDGNAAALGSTSIVLTASSLADEVSQLGDRLAGRGTENSTGSTTADEGDIVVQASRAAVRAAAQKPADGTKGLSLREIYNETGKSIGTKLDTALGTKFLSGIGNKLGDALNGAGKGQFASSIASAIGLKQSKTGAAIGGAIGGATGIPFASEIGGLIGGTIGGLFKKAKVGSAGISTDQYGQLGASAATGTSSSLKTTATGLAGNVANSLQSIADQLGAKLTGASDVKIGTYKDQIRVSTNGTPIGGKGSSGAQTFADEQSAVEYAVRSAIEDGILSGISQASLKILKSGQDLTKALNKALLIESIPKRLLQATDPVRAAVEDLNKQYSELIAALNEGGASAQQYADAQKLYDIDRAKTIADAAKSATSAIDDYLKDMLGGSSSPLNKQTVYNNAKADLATAQTDFASGKIDDQALVAAAQKFQDASRALNGSDSSFFSDFDALTKLLTDAKASKSVVVSGADTLPGSPFANDAGVQAALASSSAATVKATQDQTAALLSKLDELIDAATTNSGGGFATDSKGGSSLDNLAAFRTAL